LNLLFLSKRRPMSRDLISRPYGRFYHIPRLLALSGHSCTVLLLNYKNEPEETTEIHGIQFISINTGYIPARKYIRKASSIIDSENIDCVIGFSDTYYGILAQYLASKHDIKSIIDAYDNFESYLNWLKPLHSLWRRATRKATHITVAGPGLADLMAKSRPDHTATIVPMAADPEFKPETKNCRSGFDLPEDKKIIGYCGSISSSRDIGILFEAFSIVKETLPDAILALSGRLDNSISLPPDCIWLGYLPDDKMPDLMNSLDLLVVVLKPGDFGDFSYPVKLYEALATSTPVIATDTPATRWILDNNEKVLVQAFNKRALANSITRNIQNPDIQPGKPGWNEAASIYNKLIES